MKKFLLYLLLCLATVPIAKAQNGFDKMVELTGIIMSSDSLRYLPRVAVRIKGTDIGTLSNQQGVFSLIAPKGSTLQFSSLGFKKEEYRLPDTLSTNHYSLIQLLTQDTFYLPTTIVRPLMTQAEFERAFVNWDIPPDQIEMARRNTEINTLRAMAYILPKDGAEHLDQYQKAEASRLYWLGGQPPGGITAMPGGGFAINPMAFAEFFRAWKRGDFKKKY